MFRVGGGGGWGEAHGDVRIKGTLIGSDFFFLSPSVCVCVYTHV